MRNAVTNSFGWRVATVFAALVASGTLSRAALVDFYFTGATTDPVPARAAVGHLLYNDADFSISDLTFSIGGQPAVSYLRDTFQTEPLLVSLSGERQLFLTDLWVASGRSLFFAGPDADLKQAFGDFNPDLVQVGIGKWSDVAPVPEPSTIYAGLLLMIPMGCSILRRCRRFRR